MGQKNVKYVFRNADVRGDAICERATGTDPASSPEEDKQCDQDGDSNNSG